MDDIRGYSDGKLFLINLIFGGGLLLLYTCQGIIIGIRFGIRKWLGARRAKRGAISGSTAIIEANKNDIKKDSDIGKV